MPDERSPKPRRKAEARDLRIQRWITFSLKMLTIALCLAWLGRELFQGEEAAARLALTLLGGFLGFGLGAKSRSTAVP